MEELSNAAIGELIAALAGEYTRSLNRKERAAFLRGVSEDLTPIPPAMVNRGQAAAMREAAEWWLHKMPKLLRD